MKTRITILCENSVGNPFDIMGEHGFSCFVETESGNYLFDTGQGMTILNNAQVLKKDLRGIKAVLLSHGHYDHTGGLPAVLKQRGKVDVYAHSELFAERFWEKDAVRRDIGIPYRRAYLESLGANFILGEELVEPGPGIFLSAEIPRKSAFEKNDPNMTLLNSDGCLCHPDPLRDDLSMIIEADKGLIIVLGCAHAGLINIVDYVINSFGSKRIYAIIGGTHLGFASDEQFSETLKMIEFYDIQHLGVSHCTGLERASQLHAQLGERFFFGSAGVSIEG